MAARPGLPNAARRGGKNTFRRLAGRVNLGRAAAVLQVQQAGTSADHIAYPGSAGERDTDEYASA